VRRFLLALGVVLLLVVLVLAGFLIEAHVEVRGVAPPLPEPGEILSALAVPDAPVRLRYVNTATQDPIAHPAFLLEWADGRGLLIDAGMDRESAIEFGRLIEWALGSPPVEPHGSLPEQMGAAAGRIRAIAFTHLHTDHTAGILSLCQGREAPLLVFQTAFQVERVNYTTRPGLAHVEQASCAEPLRVAFAAGGHTPGSTIFFARVQDRIWVHAGDITNFRENLLLDRPKPWAYSYLITPEARGRLAQLRPWLAGLDQIDAWSVVVSHDHAALLQSGIEAWTPSAP
jgi:glyoxylase-like metal-dependent hydrolase (beta-lactamase superfamily II)